MVLPLRFPLCFSAPKVLWVNPYLRFELQLAGWIKLFDESATKVTFVRLMMKFCVAWTSWEHVNALWNCAYQRQQYSKWFAKSRWLCNQMIGFWHLGLPRSWSLPPSELVMCLACRRRLRGVQLPHLCSGTLLLKIGFYYHSSLRSCSYSALHLPIPSYFERWTGISRAPAGFVYYMLVRGPKITVALTNEVLELSEKVPVEYVLVVKSLAKRGLLSKYFG